MLFNKFKQNLKTINGVKFHFVKTNSKQLFCSIATQSGSNFENIKSDDEIVNYKNGTAHFVEHLLFHNSVENEYFTSTYRRNAIIHNAMTSPQLINFFINTNKVDFLNLAFEKVVKSVFSFSTNQDWFNKEKNVINSEILNYEEKDEWLSIRKKFTTARNIIGTKKSLEQINLSECESFYKNNFKVENTDIFIVGDIDEQFIELVENKFSQIKTDIEKTYEINMFTNKSNFIENVANKVVLDQNDYEITNLSKSQQLFTTIIAINSLDYNFSDKSFKEMFRIYRYLNHFSIVREEEFYQKAEQKGLYWDHTGIKLLYFDNTTKTFYIQLIIANIDNQYSSKRINSKLDWLRNNEQEIFENIDETLLSEFIENKLKIGQEWIDSNQIEKINNEFSYDTLVNNFVIYGFDNIDIKNELSIENIKMNKIKSFDNYINLTINNKE